MRFGQIMRITEDKPKTRALQIIDFINQDPGADHAAIARGTTMPLGSVGPALHRLSANGDIKSVKLDGKLRYYPKNYLLSNTLEVAAEVKRITSSFRCDVCGREFDKPKALSMHKMRLHEKTIVPKKQVNSQEGRPGRAALLVYAKDYAWENPDDAATIRRFVDYINGR